MVLGEVLGSKPGLQEAPRDPKTTKNEKTQNQGNHLLRVSMVVMPKSTHGLCHWECKYFAQNCFEKCSGNWIGSNKCSNKWNNKCSRMLQNCSRQAGSNFGAFWSICCFVCWNIYGSNSNSQSISQINSGQYICISNDHSLCVDFGIATLASHDVVESHFARTAGFFATHGILLSTLLLGFLHHSSTTVLPQ